MNTIAQTVDRMCCLSEATPTIICRRGEGSPAITHNDVNARASNEIDCPLGVGAISDDISGADHVRWIKAKTLGNPEHRTRCFEISIASTEDQKRLCCLYWHAALYKRHAMACQQTSTAARGPSNSFALCQA